MSLDRREFLTGGVLGLTSLSLMNPTGLMASSSKGLLPLTAAGYPYKHVKTFMTGEAAIKGCSTHFEVDKIGDLNNHIFSGPQTRWITEVGLAPFMLA
jgi:hypothetical protein